MNVSLLVCILVHIAKPRDELNRAFILFRAVPFLVTFPEACSINLQCVLVYYDTVS